MKPYTIKQLAQACIQEIKAGNGNKVIMISDDDEGNGYHYLWYLFTDIEDEYYDADIDEEIADREDTIILG